MIDSLVDRLVIRGDDPREPHASESWLKIRAVAVAIAPATLALGILHAIGAPEIVTWVVPIAVVLVAVKLVARPINERIEELEQPDDTAGTGGQTEQ